MDQPPEPESTKQKSGQIIPPGKKKINVLGFSFIIDEHYELNKVIGKGAYGVVASGVNKKTGETVAIKKMMDIFSNLGDTKRVLREIRILKFLKHRNIISLLDILSINDEENFSQIYLVFELMASNLATVINQIELNDRQIQTLIYQLLSGIHYMHSADIIHRDLKPENLLVSKKCDLKIGDLNLARKCEEQDDSNSIYVVTRWYRAPEVLLFSSSYTKAIDIWSAGCILAELVGRTILFKGQDYMDQFMRIVAIMGHASPEDFEGDTTVTENLTALLKSISSFSRDKVNWQQLFKKANPQCLDLLDHMLVYNPKKRYTVEQCLNHPYLKQQYKAFPPQKCSQVIDWSFDNLQVSESVLRCKIIQQINGFRSSIQNSNCFKRSSPSTESASSQSPRKVFKKQQKDQ